MAVSSSEARYIIESCLEDFRLDGRSRTEHRPYTITNVVRSKNKKVGRRTDVVPSLILSNGSSRVHLPGSSTDVLCSVKADIVRPSPARPDEGVIELAADLSLSGGGIGGGALGGGGTQAASSSAGSTSKRQRRDEESSITSLLSRLVLPHAVNYKELAIWPGRYVWRLSVDLVVMRCDGCVLDACSIAMREALRCTLLPSVTAAAMDGGDGGGPGGANAVAGGGGGTGGGGSGGGKGDLIVDGDVSSASPPAGAEDCPLVSTVSILTAPPSITGRRHQSRSVPVIDARTEEEVCATSRVCVSVDPSGMVCGVHTLGGGGGALLDDDENGDGGGNSGGGGGSMPLNVLGGVVSSAAVACGNLYKLLLADADDGARGGGMVKRRDVVDDDGYGYLLRDHFLIQ